MSASREKKNRQDLASQGIQDPKAIREAEEKAQQRKANRLYGAIAVVFVLVAALLVVVNSGVLERSATAITVDGENYTAAQVNYYYYGIKNSIINSGYSSFYGIDTSVAMDKQNMSDTAKMLLQVTDEGDITWDQFFRDYATRQLSVQVMAAKEAEANGMGEDDDIRAEVNEVIDNITAGAKEQGYTLKSYLKLAYGSTMTVSTFKKMMTLEEVATHYMQHYQEELSYTESQLEEYYQANSSDFDVASFVTAQGFARTGMLTVLIGALANIALDPLFIFALDMGVRGAALATVLSQALSCVWVTSFLCGKKTLLRLRRENLLSGLRLVPPCIALGSSSFVMQASESVISVCFNSSLLKYGGDLAVGAMTILTSVMQFALLPLTGLSQGAQPITSYNYGARNTDRVRQSFRLLLRACLIYSMMLWAFVMLCPRVFAGLFTTDAALLAFTSRALRIYCGGLGLFGIQIACQMTLVSTGNAVCSIIVAVLRKFVLLIPLIYILPCFLPDPTTAVYLAEPVADVLAVTFTAVLFSVQFKKSLQKLETPLQ